jgi:hypothetical protein
MTVRCAFCLEGGHVKADCPMLGVVHVRTTETPATADDAYTALQDRTHTLRAALRGTLIVLRRAGILLDPETAALVAAADSFDP